MTRNFSEILPQELGALMALKEAMNYGDLSLLGIALAGLETAEYIKQQPSNDEYHHQGRIGSRRKNRPSPAERADKIAEKMLKAGKSPQEIGVAVAAVLKREG